MDVVAVTVAVGRPLGGKDAAGLDRRDSAPFSAAQYAGRIGGGSRNGAAWSIGLFEESPAVRGEALEKPL